jgi:hypoxanthine phosphoribosyltransferase
MLPLDVNGRKYPFGKSVIASEEQILARIREIAKQIAADYAGKVSATSPLVLVCVLKGSYLFTADLARALSDQGIPNHVDFICVSSYGKNTVSSGEVRMLLDLRNSIQNRHCLIVEDIIDSSRTLDFLLKIFHTRSPASVKTVVLLDKPGGRSAKQVEQSVIKKVDYCCFVIPKEFVVGYGLDYNEDFRDLRDIIVLRPEVYEPKIAAKMHAVSQKSHL